MPIHWQFTQVNDTSARQLQREPNWTETTVSTRGFRRFFTEKAIGLNG